MSAKRIALLLVASVAASSPALADTVTWTQRASATAPSPRGGGCMAFDAARAKMVFHGGTPKGGVSNETWEWDGAAWADVTPKNANDQGPKRSFASMAYVPGKGVVMIGEDDVSVSGGTTMWTWNGQSWAAATLPGPTGRIAPSLVYDVAQQRLTMFGGASAPASDDQTWVLANGASVWMSAATTVRPKARYGSVFVYDSKRNTSVLFAGKLPNQDPKPIEDAFDWSGTAWKPFSGALPPARAFAASAFDADRGVVVVFGGLGANGMAPIDLGDTQEFDGKTWTARVTAQSPAPRVQTVAAYDSARREVVLVGGLSLMNAGQLFGDTWTYRSAGGTCTKDADCTGAFCVDGVCCSSAACSACEACNLPSSIGLCSAVKGTDDLDTCTGVDTCDAVGGCRKKLGGVCASAADCASGQCADGVCCDTPCGERCDVCAKSLGAAADGVCSPLPKGAPGTPSCAPYECSGTAVCAATCDVDEDCAVGSRCADKACVPGGGAKCEGPITLVGADGTSRSCAPFRCAAGACTTGCQTADDCAAGNACTSSGKCVPAATPTAPPADGSCACEVVGVGAEAQAGVGGLVVMLVARLRLRRRARVVSGRVA